MISTVLKLLVVIGSGMAAPSPVEVDLEIIKLRCTYKSNGTNYVELKVYRDYGYEAPIYKFTEDTFNFFGKRLVSATRGDFQISSITKDGSQLEILGGTKLRGEGGVSPFDSNFALMVDLVTGEGQYAVVNPYTNRLLRDEDVKCKPDPKCIFGPILAGCRL